MTQAGSTYEYIVVGAGSAGCVLAARLSENAHARVLLVEAGGDDSAKEVRIPAAFSKLFKSTRDWNYSTEEEPCLNGRRLYWPRGKMLGGSSSMNAMIYIRGNPSDYESWKTLGNEGWGWADVLPYFKKSENQERGASQFHGAGGPVNVCDLRDVNELTRAFLAGALETGIPANEDFNGRAGWRRLVSGHAEERSEAERGRRLPEAGAATPQSKGVDWRACYSRNRREQSRERSRVRAERRDGRSTGRTRDDPRRGFRELAPASIALRGRPGTRAEKGRSAAPSRYSRRWEEPAGSSEVSVGYVCEKPVSLASAESASNFLRWLIFRRGPLTSNVAEAGIFLRTEEGLSAPNLQILFGPAYYVNHGLDKRKEHCFGFGPTLLAPESRGSISLRSANPLDGPAIRANYLSTGRDLGVVVEGIRRSRQIAHAKVFQPYRGAELHPGSEITTADQLAAFVRANVQTLYHPVGTCKMGSDTMAVVDNRLRVRGIEQLRVADASVMPRIISGNTNPPTIMIAEKAADMIREDN